MLSVRLQPKCEPSAGGRTLRWATVAGAALVVSNDAGSVPAVDWLFGTLHLSDHRPSTYGCDGHVPDVGYIARCISPWSQRPS